ncbi:MAG: acetolactate decarboxylase [Gaiellales bacterium]
MPVDDGLIGGIHVSRLARREAAADTPHDHEAFQASTLDALMRGELKGDLTIGELLRHGDLGLGTVNLLDGELIVVDGEALVARVDGTVERVPDDTRTPFAVVCRFAADAEGPIGSTEGFDAVTDVVDALAPPDATCLAVRIDARIAGARLRSVPKQTQPSPTLADAVAAQVEFDVGAADATIVGFRFPRDAAGLELPGWHLHLVTKDRTAGGHLLNVTVVEGTIAVERETELAVEVPAGVDLGSAGADASRDAALDEMERGR